MALPNILHFEGIGLCFYSLGPFREPKKGEFYLSGAIVAAYKAPNDLPSRYRIATPTYYAVQATGHVKGELVKL